ncbi:MAG TPA: lipoyl synthase [bacterium (Candidatus Stahlbacteria)]|nr:lipoyl synthase [Candidatus Stahlbacteria bacterium]
MRPVWLKTELPGRGEFVRVRKILKVLNLDTVCHEARCPNLGRCWADGTATIMILGSICTRSCRFCAVKTGRPKPVDPAEVTRVAEAVKDLAIKYLVLTSVDRDDLADGGASHFAETVRMVKKTGAKVEVLVPDFSCSDEAIEVVVRSGPDVFGHNLETVRRLNSTVRDRRCNYDISLSVLKKAKEMSPGLITKTGIMVGLGEAEQEVYETMVDAKRVGVQIFTIGQYLQPTKNHLPVKEYVEPGRFNRYLRQGSKLGLTVISGPLVRSSYKAHSVYQRLRRKDGCGGVYHYSNRDRKSLIK